MGFLDILSGAQNALKFGSGLFDLFSQNRSYEYMKDMQQEAWNREDTAVQRRAADLKAAGINPLLAAGSAASSSSPVQIGAPQMDPNAVPDAAGQLMALTAAKKNIAQTEADTARIGEVTWKQQMENKAASAAMSMMTGDGKPAYIQKAMNDFEISNNQKATSASVLDKAVADADYAKTNADILKRDFDIAKGSTIPFANLSGSAQQAADFGNILKTSNKGGTLLGSLLSILTKAGPSVISNVTK